MPLASPTLAAPQPEETKPSRGVDRLKRTAHHSPHRAVLPNVPKYVNITSKETMQEEEDSRSVASSVTMPHALQPKRKKSVQASLFHQAVEDQQREILSKNEPDHGNSSFKGLLGLEPKEIAQDKKKKNQSSNDTPAPSPSRSQNIFRRFQVSLGGPFKNHHDTTPPRGSPRPHRHGLDDAEMAYATPEKLVAHKHKRHSTFLPAYLFSTPSYDDDSFLAEITTDAVGEVLSEALGDDTVQETRDDDDISKSQQGGGVQEREDGLEEGRGCAVVEHKSDGSTNEEQMAMSVIQNQAATASQDGSRNSVFSAGSRVANSADISTAIEATGSDTGDENGASKKEKASLGSQPGSAEHDLSAVGTDEEQADPIPSSAGRHSVASRNSSTPFYKRKCFRVVLIVVAACFAGTVAGYLTGKSQDNDAQSTDSSSGDNNDSGNSGFATSSPTLASTNSPSLVPSLVPSFSPTSLLSLEPSAMPTSLVAPISSPTVHPTLPPTNKPLSFHEMILANSPKTQLALDQQESPQSRALQWLEQHTKDLNNDEALQRFALATLFHSLNATKDGWNDHGAWLSLEESECSWYGVSCNSKQQVALINLNDNNLGGTLAEEVSLLSNLEILSLAGSDSNENGNIVGTIPTSWGDLTNLEALELYENTLSGPIPDTFGKLSGLKTLRLNHNELSDSLPIALGDLTSLETLELSANRFSNQLPSELGKLTNLAYLGLARNRFVNGLPSELGQLGNSLTELHLNGNTLTGFLPPEIWTLSTLRWVAIYNNQFQGTLPGAIGQLENIEGIQFHGNSFEGPVPAEIRQLSKLRVLDLSRNNLNGTTPTQLQFLTNLAGLYLQENNFTGQVPKLVCELMDRGLRRFWSDCISETTCSCCTRCF